MGDGTLYLRYSGLCQANWAKFVIDSTVTSLAIWVHNSNGNYAYYSGSATVYPWYIHWSAMIDGTVASQACVTYQTNITSGSGCTDWY